MARHRSRRQGGLPRLLVRLIHAAEQSARSRGTVPGEGVPDALRQLGELALWALPVHGVFVPSSNGDDLEKAIVRVAREHLALDAARKELRRALGAVAAFEARDPIESAINHIQSISDEAHYYAGLAFGITLAEFAGK